MQPNPLLFAALATFAACSGGARPAEAPYVPPTEIVTEGARAAMPETTREPAPPPREGLASAVFAGGCFWCMEPPFEALDGVVSAESGYAGGSAEDATYDHVSSGVTLHLESVRVVYDPARVSYARLAEVFLANVDPTQGDGQFCDHGPQYRAAFFVANDAERAEAERALAAVRARLGRELVVAVNAAMPFYRAEAYHQDFYRTHAETYLHYRQGCGRDARLRALYGDAAGGH